MASDFAGSVVHSVVDGMRCDAADPEEVEGCPDNGGREVEIDAKNFRVMQGREKEKPKRKKVDSLKRAIQAKRPIDRVIVYEDAATSDKYAPNGGHRQQAFDELGLPVPATLFTVPSARERAEEESCYANEDNGADRSPADTRFQAKKAFGLLRKKLGRIPKPVELSRATHTSLKFAGAFLRELFSSALSDPEGVDESETGIPLELQKILDGLKKIKPAINWEPGDKSKPMLSAIAKELRRISRHKRPEAELKPEDLKRFMDAKRINNAQMAKLAEVSHTTVARWLAGKVKMSDSNARILRDAMSYSDEHLAVILDDDATEMDTEAGNE